MKENEVVKNCHFGEQTTEHGLPVIFSQRYQNERNAVLEVLNDHPEYRLNESDFWILKKDTPKCVYYNHLIIEKTGVRKIDAALPKEKQFNGANLLNEKGELRLYQHTFEGMDMMSLHYVDHITGIYMCSEINPKNLHFSFPLAVLQKRLYARVVLYQAGLDAMGIMCEDESEDFVNYTHETGELVEPCKDEPVKEVTKPAETKAKVEPVSKKVEQEQPKAEVKAETKSETKAKEPAKVEEKVASAEKEVVKKSPEKESKDEKPTTAATKSAKKEEPKAETVAEATPKKKSESVKKTASKKETTAKEDVLEIHPSDAEGAPSEEELDLALAYQSPMILSNPIRKLVLNTTNPKRSLELLHKMEKSSNATEAGFAKIVIKALDCNMIQFHQA